jgi:ubiquinone/menaquinone biosynthesis C-methylase UbiE
VSNTDYAHPEYVLGHSDSELDRLIRQSALYGDLTRHTLDMAGLRPGMHVLDVGCGAGDVSFLAASMVGESGSVVGVDQNADALAMARGRAAAAGLTHVSFERGDIVALPYAGRFDAVIGRLVLIYVADPAAAVRAFAGYARPGGLLYSQEFVEPKTFSVPPIPLFAEAIRVINETFSRAGLDLYIGMRVPGFYRTAGVVPRQLAMARVEGGVDSAAYAYMAQTVRSLLPMAEKHGVTTAEAFGADTFADRLRAQTLELDATLHLPELLATWARVA